MARSASHKTTKQLGVLSLRTTCFWLAAKRLATIFSVLVKADSMSALSLSRLSSVVKRVPCGIALAAVAVDGLATETAVAEAGSMKSWCDLRPTGAAEHELAGLELVTALGGTGVEGSSGIAVKAGTATAVDEELT